MKNQTYNMKIDNNYIKGITDEISKVLNTSLLEISTLENKKEVINNDIILALKDLEIITNTSKSINERIQKENKDLEVRTKSLDEFEKTINIKNTEINKLVDLSTLSLEQHRKELENLGIKINSLNKEILDNKKLKDTLTRETDKLKIDVSLLLEDVSEDSIIKSDESKKLQIDINSKKNELLILSEEINKQKEIILPKLNDLEIKEKKLKDREDTVNILINRYTKLFGDKGIHVKI